MTDTLTVRALAKINLTLDVLGTRPDGYHNIRSVMQTIALADTLTVTRTPGIAGVQLTIDGSEAAGIPNNARNSVHKAAVRLQKSAAARGLLPAQETGLHLHLTKHIPSEAGLGGGSSDCAAALLAVNTLLGLHLPRTRLAEIAAALGADVPFFLTGGMALVEGLGEQVTPLAALHTPWPIVIIKPAVGMSTPKAYAALDALPERIHGTATDQWLRNRPATEMHTGNDFEQAVLPALPTVQRVFARMRGLAQAHSCFAPRLCGSGSAVFLPCPNAETAQGIADTLTQANLGTVWVTQTLKETHDS